jgi:hypothetical protein
VPYLKACKPWLATSGLPPTRGRSHGKKEKPPPPRFRPPATPRRPFALSGSRAWSMPTYPRTVRERSCAFVVASAPKIPRSVVLFAFPHAVVAEVPLVAPFHYVVVENDVVIVDPGTVALADLRKEHKPTTARSHLAHWWFCKLDLDDKILRRSMFSKNWAASARAIC